MIKNFFKIAYRNFIRQKGYSLINILGLAIGLASAILIFIFIMNEMSYDKCFKNYDRIYLVYMDGQMGANALHAAWTPAPMGPTLKKDFPEVEYSVRMQDHGNVLIRYQDKKFFEKTVLYADSTFFDVFSIPLIKGNPDNVLKNRYSLVITPSAAKRIFGDDDPVGKMIRLNQDTAYYTVTGIMEEVPSNAHFEAEVVASFHTLENSNSTMWLNNSYYTYVMLQPGASAKELESKFPAMIEKYAGPQIQEGLGITIEDFLASGNRYGYFLQPLTDIHLDTEIEHGLKPSNNKKYIYIFAFVALFILVIACINFMNLATARSAKRSREIGIRKVVGSDRRLLIGQFLTESILLSLLSLAGALIILELVLPYFNNTLHLSLTLGYFEHWYFIPAIVGIAVFTGLVAGIYPAMFLSSFKPVNVLKGRMRGRKGGNGILRGGLVVFQFFIAIVILTGTIIINRQLNYMQNVDLGFHKEHMLVLDRAEAIGKKREAFKQQLQTIPGVVSVTNSTAIPGYPNNNNGFMIEGQKASNTVLIMINWVDYDFLKTYGLKLEDGRFFSKDFPGDTAAMIINETGLKKLGIKDPLDTRLIQPGKEDERHYIPIVGVTKDYHFESLEKKIGTYGLMFKPLDMGWGGYYTIRLNAGDIKGTISKIEDVWDEMADDYPMNYFFLDERFNQLYQEEQRTSKISFIFTFLSIFIASLGLIGLISYTSEQRTKEIGIRKIMGASVASIIMRLSWETVKYILIATLLGWALSWFVMSRWLEDFAYRINLNPWYFMLATFVIFVIAIVTISFQAFRASVRNPAESLRYE